jgi:hypothetical protein
MGAELGQHVVQEGDPGVDLMLPFAVQAKANLHIRLCCATLNKSRSGLERARGV